MPNGKPAGTPCIQLDEDYRCKLFGKPERPAFCGGLQPDVEMCGDTQQTRTYAINWLSALELATRPDSTH
jgi:uncharacterized protein